jgi:fatty acid desaturase
MSAKEIRTRDLPPGLLEKSPALAVFHIASTWALIFAIAIAVGHVHWWAVWPLAVIAIGILQHRITILGHHSLHGDFSRSRAFNMIVGRWFLNAPLLAAFAPVRFNHLTHHKSLGEEHDYERILYDLSCGQRVNSRRVLLWLLKMSLGGAIIASLGRYVGLSHLRRNRLPVPRSNVPT